MTKDTQPDAPFSRVEDVIEDLRAGKMAVILDDEDRENEGDLVCAAEFVTPEVVNFMATHGRGLICLPMTPERLEELEIPLMVQASRNTARRGTAFCVSIEARREITTGISAADRARTIRIATDPASRPGDLASPGHVFPLRSTPGGVLRRAGHTEASVDLCRMGGLRPAAVICEIMNPDGTMARLEELTAFSRQHGLKMMTIAQLISYRMRTERLVKRIASAEIETRMGRAKVHGFHHELEDQTLLVLVVGEPRPDEPTLVRVHAGALLDDVFAPPARSQLEVAMERIRREGHGVVLYLHLADGGIPRGLRALARAGGTSSGSGDAPASASASGEVSAAETAPVRGASETSEADHRNYGIGAQVLHDLGVRRLRLMTNSEGKYVGLTGYGLEIVERVPLPVEAEASSGKG